MSKKRQKDSVDIGILGDLLGYRLRRAQLAFFSAFSETCAELGVSPGLFAVIEIVHRNPGLTQTAVAKSLGTDRSAMVAAVDKLERLELIERCAAKNDRRSYALQLTEKGAQWYIEAERRLFEHEQEFYDLLKPGEREQLLDMLARLAERPNKIK